MELLKFASDLQARLGMRVSFDAAIGASLHERDSAVEARRKFDSMYGSLSKKTKKGFWKDLEDEKRADRVAIERKASSYT